MFALISLPPSINFYAEALDLRRALLIVYKGE